MTLSENNQKKALIILLAILAILVIYRIMTVEKPKTAPLIYKEGAVAATTTRPGISTRSGDSDPLNIFFRQREERFPGVSRDIFKTANPVPKPKAMLKPVTLPTPTAPPVPVKTPEEIAADLAKADLSKFRLLGTMIDDEITLFLSKGGESFIAKKGDIVQKGYKVIEATKDYAILLDTITRVQVRLEITGSEQLKTR